MVDEPVFTEVDEHARRNSAPDPEQAWPEGGESFIFLGLQVSSDAAIGSVLRPMCDANGQYWPNEDPLTDMTHSLG